VPLHKTRRVKRNDPCPVCHRPTWCLVALDGRYAVRMRVESSRPSRSASGGWVHMLQGGPQSTIHTSATPVSVARNVVVAPIERLDRVYRQLQAAMELGGNDLNHVLERGFTNVEIKALGYRTLYLHGRARLAREACRSQFDELPGVPGFCVAVQGDHWTLAGSPGLVIPCRDAHDRIRGYLIRPHEQGSGGKYRWLSSSHKPSGTGRRACCHIARPTTAGVEDDAVWIAEGEIKSDLSANQLRALMVSIPGVNLWARAIPELAELLPAGGRVVVALDADWQKKPPVHDALWCLVQCCGAMGYSVEVALWDAKHKGLDDLLITGQSPRRTSVAEIPAPPWVLKVSSRMLTEMSPRKAQKTMPLKEMRDQLEKVLASLCPST
jgi:hypothetical protein